MRYPLEPLFTKMGGSHDSSRRTLSMSGSQFNAYQRHGFSEDTAEKFAVRAGFHPFEVWPEMVEDVIDDVLGRPTTAVLHLFVTCVECGRPLLPSPGHVKPDGTAGQLSAVCRVGHINHVSVVVEHRGTFVEHGDTPVSQASEQVDSTVNGSSDLSWCDEHDLTRKAAV